MDKLDRAVSALRDEVATGPGLSPAGRARIAAACYDECREPLETFRPSFQPRAWLSIAAFAPIVLAAVAVVTVRPGGNAVDSHTPMFVAASKTGDEVVFQVADGPGPHAVVKSTDPSRFNPAAATLVTDGRYADVAEGGPVIVYYRID